MGVTVTAVLSKFGQLGAAAQQQNQAALRSALRARGLDLKLPQGNSIPGMLQYAVAAAHARSDALEKLGDAASPDEQKAKLQEVADAFLSAVGFLDRACYRAGEISQGLLELDELRASDRTFLYGVNWRLPFGTKLRDRARVRTGVDIKSPIVGESLEPGTPIVIAGYGVSPFLQGESTERVHLTSPVEGWISCSQVEDGELLKQLARRSRQAALPRVPVAKRPPTPVQKSTRWQHEGTSLFESSQADAAGRAHEAARACGGGRRLGETTRKDAEGRDECCADDGVDEDDAHR
jgi:hypothetical protein